MDIAPPRRGPLSRTLEDPKDEAIRELAHVARCLLEAATADGNATVPGAFKIAVSNKIEYYASKAES
jgi:hypothetical protein